MAGCLDGWVILAVIKSVELFFLLFFFLPRLASSFFKNKDILEMDLLCPEENHLSFVSWLRTCRESMFHCPGVTEPSAPSMGNGPLGETGMG